MKYFLIITNLIIVFACDFSFSASVFSSNPNQINFSHLVGNARPSIKISRETPYQLIRYFMQDVKKQYPGTVSIFSLGRTDSGNFLEGLKIGNGPAHHLVVAAHHGNETGSTEVAKVLATTLAADPIVGKTIYIIPVLNISGYDAEGRNEWNGNDWVDSNRDYPGPCGSDNGPNSFTLRSTRALAGLLEKENITAIATLHNPFSAIIYPWCGNRKETLTMTFCLRNWPSSVL